MKKILCFLSKNDYMALEAVACEAEDGDEILFLGCDKTVGICHENNTASTIRCALCRKRMYQKVIEFKRRFPQLHVQYNSISSLTTEIIIKNAENASFDYNNINELKMMQYKGVNIGYAAFSDFVSCTRNITPTFNDYFHKYIDFNLRRGIILTEVVENILLNERFDLIVFHNGRFVNVKPFCDIAKKHGITYIATETVQGKEGIIKKNFFYNGIPHGVKERNKKVEDAWTNAGADAKEIGRSFFENRYHARPAGDKVYTKDQKLGLLPEGFDVSKRNISIFNSSEDEFCSISKEIDDGMLFKTQYEALKCIFEHYKHSDDIHFYLRIHPNLASVPYKSHTALYELTYPNVTIISPTSPISSYTLMESSEKIIVFNSTIGVESSYWGKPVIGLNHYIYDLVWHMPSDVNELYEMIDNPLLPRIDNKIDCYKIACYLLGYHTEDFKYYPTIRRRERLMGRDWDTLSQFTIFGRPLLATAFEQFICMISRKLFNADVFPNNLAELTK